jgi:hypothetical protein
MNFPDNLIHSFNKCMFMKFIYISNTGITFQIPGKTEPIFSQKLVSQKIICDTTPEVALVCSRRSGELA